MIDWSPPPPPKKKKVNRKIPFGSCNPPSLPLFPGPLFVPNILPTISRGIHNYQWLIFRHSLQNFHLVAESFFNFWNVSESSFLILSLMFPRKCPCFGENFLSMQISPTKLMTSSKMSHSLVIDLTNRLREYPWHCMATAFGYYARIWVRAPDFFSIMFDAPSYVWPLHSHENVFNHKNNGTDFNMFQLVEAYEIFKSIQIFIDRSQTER